MELLLLGAMLLIAIAMVVYALRPNKREQADAVKRRTAGLRADQDLKVLKSRAHQRASGRTVLEKAAPVLSKVVMPKDAAGQSNLKAKLASAGFRRDSAATLFLASKTAGALVCGLIGALLALNAGKEMIHVVGQTFIGAAIGLMLPNLWLNMSVKKRVESITNGLPDSLDLMVVAVEAGLGLDAALLRVSDEMRNVHPNLAEEFQIASVETQMGVARSEALQRMATRSAVTEMKALVAVISQAEKLGTSIAQALRTQSEALRTKRRQKAEERAQKTAVKLLLPLILFIFPAIFVVLAGPAAIKLMNTFGGK